MKLDKRRVPMNDEIIKNTVEIKKLLRKQVELIAKEISSSQEEPVTSVLKKVSMLFDTCSLLERVDQAEKDFRR